MKGKEYEMDKRKEYEKPGMEIIEFDDENDIITDSNETPGNDFSQ